MLSSSVPEIAMTDIKLGDELGRGGFSVVFSGAVKQTSGPAVLYAAKRFADEKFFKAERDTMLRLQSDAKSSDFIVRLVGQVSAERMLLYELMPGGDLDSMLPKLSSADARLR